MGNGNAEARTEAEAESPTHASKIKAISNILHSINRAKYVHMYQRREETQYSVSPSKLNLVRSEKY